jgi:hypothetical protein
MLQQKTSLQSLVLMLQMHQNKIELEILIAQEKYF